MVESFGGFKKNPMMEITARPLISLSLGGALVLTPVTAKDENRCSPSPAFTPPANEDGGTGF